KSRLCEKVEESADAVLSVDIGGGSGHVLKDFVQNPGHRTGRLILQDLPIAMKHASELTEQGVQAMLYGFLTLQPVKGGIGPFSVQRASNIFIPEQKRTVCAAFSMTGQIVPCKEILRNTAAVMRKGPSKLLLVDEMVLPDIKCAVQGCFLDLSMIVIDTGAERTNQQWHDLLPSAGLRIEKIWTTKFGLESAIEAELAG
ncbi:MAG: hypothetical protein L6R39_005931, partial [Caloplaca ligustica]